MLCPKIKKSSNEMKKIIMNNEVYNILSYNWRVLSETGRVIYIQHITSSIQL